MNQVHQHPPRVSGHWPARAALALLVLAAVSGCGEKEKKPGQTLARVNGEEITVLQLNEELQRANVQAGQQAAASQQILESLIDRQLLLEAAAKEKLDRDPKVVQAIERAKALIVAQAYLQKQVGAPTKPSAAEVADFYQKNPLAFSGRKVFEMRQLLLATKDLTPELKAAVDGAKSLDEVAAWMDGHKVAYGRAQLARSSADLPPELSSKMLSMNKGQLFIVREGERSLLMTITDIKDAPVPQDAAAPQIEQLLANKHAKDAAAAQVKQLRASAKIEYLNGASAPAAQPGAAAPAAPVAAPDSAPAASASDASGDAAARGVAGMK
ncbi:EpsD family peptidyl-prolyl cis-trans isomerase [Oxalobacteraceae bacterium A2-2]